MRLHGKTVVLTGATGGIGGAYLRAFVAAGANVVATDVAGRTEFSTTLVEKVGAQGPGRAVFVAADVTSDSDWTRVVGRARDLYGGLDVLVNNAAVYQGLAAKRPLLELSTHDWDTVLRVNVRGTWQGIRAVAPAMRARGGGRIVNISSTVARVGPPGFAHYVASKAAVDGLTRAAARELGPYGITVNAVAPGLVDDEASRALNTDSYLSAAAQARAVRRDMTPDDLVGAVLFLSTDASAFISGQTLVVDGGGIFS
jgi:NAD(P)-dependent dehydrogenase (short-subunit alcohol dehydrogenase family)